jgi:hypothetical protein
MKKLLLSLLALLAVGCAPIPVGSTEQTVTTPSTQADVAEREPTVINQEATTSTESTTSTEMTGPTQGETAAEAGLRPPSPVAADLDHADLLQQLLLDIRSREDGLEILAQIQASGDTRFVAGLIDVLRYQRSLMPEISATLGDLTGAKEIGPDWFDWVEWAGKHPEYVSFDNYDRWKSNLFALIDPNFMRFVYPGVKVAPDSRIEEIVWGGVRVDGIPALDNPKMIDPAEATYLVSHERVFGVSINGDSRAYPARFLDWHEMFNDIVGDEPVSLAY